VTTTRNYSDNDKETTVITTRNYSDNDKETTVITTRNYCDNDKGITVITTRNYCDNDKGITVITTHTVLSFFLVIFDDVYKNIDCKNGFSKILLTLSNAKNTGNYGDTAS